MTKRSNALLRVVKGSTREEVGLHALEFSVGANLPIPHAFGCAISTSDENIDIHKKPKVN